VRAGHVTDQDIAAMVRDYTPRQTFDGEALFQAAEGDVDAEIIELDPARNDNEDNGQRAAS
jgi:hypothetical protein